MSVYLQWQMSQVRTRASISVPVSHENDRLPRQAWVGPKENGLKMRMICFSFQQHSERHNVRPTTVDHGRNIQEVHAGAATDGQRAAATRAEGYTVMASLRCYVGR
jgi:hypothetical protein